MSENTCHTCRFWRELPDISMTAQREDPDSVEGFCCRRAPSVDVAAARGVWEARGDRPMIPAIGDLLQGCWPRTGSGAWCGEHEETAIRYAARA